MSWTPSNNLIAQLAHIGWGGFIVTSFALFGYVGYGVLGLLVYAGVKEFVFDKYVELQPFNNNLEDFLFYVLGGIGGVILAVVAS